MTGGPGRVRSAVVLLFLAAPLVLAACGGGGYHYVKSSIQDAYLKVPSGWKVYNQKALLAYRHELSPDQREEVLKFLVADRVRRQCRDPSVTHVLNLSSEPAGLALVTTLSPNDSDQISDSSLRNYFFDVDKADNDDRLKVLDYKIEDRDGGFHGIRLVARIVVTNTSSTQAYQGKAITFDQVVLTDQARKRIYALVVACSAKCYEKHSSKIGTIVDSWTVKDS